MSLSLDKVVEADITTEIIKKINIEIPNVFLCVKEPVLLLVRVLKSAKRVEGVHLSALI